MALDEHVCAARIRCVMPASAPALGPAVNLIKIQDGNQPNAPLEHVDAGMLIFLHGRNRP